MHIASDLIREHEGYRTHPYECSEGKVTIGIGRNLTDVGLTRPEIESLFSNDLIRAVNACEGLIYFEFLDENRKAALIDMAFQLGRSGMRGFRKMHLALERQDWADGYAEALDSKWAEQTPERAYRIANILLTGEIK